MSNHTKISARSRNMAAIRAKDTKPEIFVRSLVHRMGYRFRLHVKGLPGKPDIVFRPRRKIIFVHGCFWHQHSKKSCSDARMPKSNQSYWKRKLAGNVKRDRMHVKELVALGWKVLVIWECETENADRLARVLSKFL